MADTSQQLVEALGSFEALADSATPDDAYRDLDETALQVFWRDWPQISSWAGSLWRKVNQDLMEASSPEADGDVDTGGGG